MFLILMKSHDKLKKKLFSFNKYRYGSSYEGEGKTVVNIMQKDIDAGLMIEAISLVSF